MKKGKLYLIPTPIAACEERDQIPPYVFKTLSGIQYFLAENQRTARRYLSALKCFPSIESLTFNTLDKHTKDIDLPELMKPLERGYDMGLLSEAGCPGVADPGAIAVAYAHKHGMPVVPLIGPSSILLALMASGLNGQQFAFHGYLPIKTHGVTKALKALERESREKSQTQVFIETPYRNQALFQHMAKTLHPNTLLCIAQDITGKEEQIRTQSVLQWTDNPPDLKKQPTIFLLQA